MRAYERYRGVIIMTSLAGGYYIKVKGGMACRISLIEIKREIDKLFA